MEQAVLLAADENFHHAILRGLRHHHPVLDIVLIRDTIGGADDDQVLEWAAGHGRVVLSHDVTTLGDAANQRVMAGLPMAGLILVNQPFDLGALVDDLAVVAYCSSPQEWENRTVYLPYPRS